MFLKSITILWGLVILALSLYPFAVENQGIKLIPHADKYVHLCMHALMSFLLTCNLKPRKWISQTVLILATISVLYGTVIEVIQELMNLGRHFDILDILANSIGVLLGLTGYFLLKKIQH